MFIKHFKQLDAQSFIPWQLFIVTMVDIGLLISLKNKLESLLSCCCEELSIVKTVCGVEHNYYFNLLSQINIIVFI